MAKPFYDSVRACGAKKCSSSARTAIVVIATVATNAVNKPGASNGAAPISGTNGASRGGSIIAIVNRHTGVAAGNRHRA